MFSQSVLGTHQVALQNSQIWSTAFSVNKKIETSFSGCLATMKQNRLQRKNIYFYKRFLNNTPLKIITWFKFWEDLTKEKKLNEQVKKKIYI